MARIMDVVSYLRSVIPREVFDYQVLMGCLSDYRKPRDVVTRLLSEGKIVRVKKGLYCFGELYRRVPVLKENLANLIYGPSYLSLDYALAYYGMIPERVYSLTSVTTRRSIRFDSPVGSFSYRTLPESKYSIGAVLLSVNNVSFMIASPEKALVDKIWTDKRISGRRISDFKEYLSDDLRIDHSELIKLNMGSMSQIADAYSSAKIRNLVSFLEGAVSQYA
ncbi:MAG: hypothetical protein KAR40_01140 [Candidatus Sabulitectum sp.]|nr:hypothetical protein [Candidatus Sabulitectum sp.]